MTCTPFRSADCTISGVFCTTTEHEITHEGRTWRFEYHPYLGPWPIRKDGEPFRRAPGLKSKFWVAFEAWCQKNPST